MDRNTKMYISTSWIRVNTVELPDIFNSDQAGEIGNAEKIQLYRVNWPTLWVQSCCLANDPTPRIIMAWHDLHAWDVQMQPCMTTWRMVREALNGWTEDIQSGALSS